MMTVERKVTDNATKNRIIYLRKEGFTLEEIGLAVDMTRQGVEQQLKNSGVSAKESKATRFLNLKYEVIEQLDTLVSEVANTPEGNPDDVFQLFRYKGIYTTIKPHQTKSGFFNWLRRLGLEPHWWGLIRLSGASGEWSAEEIDNWRTIFKGTPDDVANTREVISTVRYLDESKLLNLLTPKPDKSTQIPALLAITQIYQQVSVKELEAELDTIDSEQEG